MATDQDVTIGRHLSSLFDNGTVAGLTDGQLLERFATKQGGAAGIAFEVLVERHGPMVLRACRSILRNEHDAHDAFQATFLVLIRRGRSLWVRESLGPWLHRVACRAAIRARRSSQRRIMVERRMAAISIVQACPHDCNEITAVVHEEIERLPERYRAAIVLCDLQGYTCEATARLLGCPSGTIGSRLSRGRDRLRSRLLQRGVAPSLAAMGIALGREAAGEPVLANLVETTTRLAVRFHAGQAVGAVSARVEFKDEAKLLITVSDDSVKLWDGLTGSLRKEIKDQVVRPLFFNFNSPSTRFVTVDVKGAEVTTWDAETLKPIATFRPEGTSRLIGARLSSDGKILATIAEDHSVTLWDASTNRPFAIFRSPSRFLETVFVDNEVKSLKKPVLQLHEHFWNVVRDEIAPRVPEVKQSK